MTEHLDENGNIIGNPLDYLQYLIDKYAKKDPSLTQTLSSALITHHLLFGNEETNTTGPSLVDMLKNLKHRGEK